jgi:hypothetical protein
MSSIRVLGEIAVERTKQNIKWGEQNHLDGTGRPGDVEEAIRLRAKCKSNKLFEDNWRDILAEEVAETFAEVEFQKIRNELIQVAAVATAWIEAIDRRKNKQEKTK